MQSVEEHNEAPKVPEASKTVPILDGGVTEPGKTFAVSNRLLDLGEKNNKTMLYGSAGAVLVAVVGIFALSHREIPGAAKAPAPAKKVEAVQRKPGTPIPSDKAQTSSGEEEGKSAVTDRDIENTKGHSGNSVQTANQSQTASGEQDSEEETEHSNRRSDPRTGRSGAGVAGGHADLSTVPAFQKPSYSSNPGQGQFQPTPYQGAGSNSYAGVVLPSSGTGTEMMREYTEQVSKPSLIFTSQATPAKTGTGVTGQTTNDSITNFGLEPGFHVSAHLESSVSTFGNVPAVAIVEYNYIRNGQILIPAGSRIVGRLSGGSATGVVSLAFTEVYLPDGSRAPISAVGLDPTLKPIKGKVTGRNTGKAFLLASVTSVGSLGAGFLGTGNQSAVTQQSLARDQISSNIGRAGDQVVQSMVVNSQVVVTVSSGTLIEVTFTSPARTGVAGIEPAASSTAVR